MILTFLRRSRVRTTVLALLMLVALVLVAAWIADLASRSRLDAAMRVAGDHGSLEFADHIPPALPAGVANGSDFLEAAALLTDGQELTYPPPEGAPDPELAALVGRLEELDEVGDRPTADDLAQFRVLVERFDLSLAVLGRGFEEATRARYRTNYGDPPVELFIPNLMNRVRSAALLRARAEVAAADGRAGDAWRDAAAIHRVARWTSEEMRTIVNVLVARKIAAFATHLVQGLLGEAPGDSENREQVLDEARGSDLTALLGRALDGERVMMWTTLRDAGDLESVISGERSGVERILARWRPWMRWNAAVYLEIVTAEYADCRRPTFERDDTVGPGVFGWARIARDVHLSCGDLARQRDLWRASVDHLEIALALEAARDRDGAYPDALDGLGGDFVDPFSGEPYRYRRVDDGYRLWSVGRDLDDDGGVPVAPKPAPHAVTPTDGDLVWRVTRKQGGAEG